MSQRIDVLSDKTGGRLACLINCTRLNNQLFCGIVAFRGGLHGTIEVFDTEKENKFLIKVPSSVKTVATYQCFLSSTDNYTLQIEG